MEINKKVSSSDELEELNWPEANYAQINAAVEKARELAGDKFVIPEREIPAYNFTEALIAKLEEKTRNTLIANNKRAGVKMNESYQNYLEYSVRTGINTSLSGRGDDILLYYLEELKNEGFIFTKEELDILEKIQTEVNELVCLNHI
ncbi:MAG: hypothetical protein GXY86_09815 [Firmicutes bacterium]|nr:hypothetical protein [Bacillota bacterium]